MRLAKLLLIFFVIILSLSGCVSTGEDSSLIISDISEEDSSASIAESSVTVESAITEESSVTNESVNIEESSEPEIPKIDLLTLIEEHGKELIPYGDLETEEYAEAIGKLEEILDGYNKNVALVVYSLNNEKAISYNTKQEIFPASMIKAPYSLYACLEMDGGNGNLKTEMVYEQKHYEIGTGDMQYSPVGAVFDMETIISKTMSISDNVGYLMMTDYFGRDGYNEWVESLGASSLRIKPTVWSLRSKAKDWAIVWREIYCYFEKNEGNAEFLYNSCTDTAGNFATQAIDGAHYSHKQGHQRSGDWHSYSDAGIMWKGDGDYIFVILTDAAGPSSYEAKFFEEIMDVVDNELFN